MIAGGGDPRKHVDDDQGMGADRPVTALVRIAPLVAAGRDGIERHPAGGEAGALNGELEVFRGQFAASVVEPAPPDARAAQQGLGGGNAAGGAAVAGAEGGGLGGIFDFALGKDHAVRGDQFEAVLGELEGHAGGKIVRHREGADPVVRGQQENGLRGANAPVRPAPACLAVPRFQRQHHVETRGAFHPPEFQGADGAHLAAAGAERDERVGHRNATEVALVRIDTRVGVEKRGRLGHGECRVELRGTPHYPRNLRKTQRCFGHYPVKGEKEPGGHWRWPCWSRAVRAASLWPMPRRSW